jgi:glycine dehydrogenase subunit 1
MLAAIGIPSVEDLFSDIPEGVRFRRELDLEPALSEPELAAHLEELARRNVDTRSELSFLGAGVYDHYVPAVVDAILQRGEFLTAYTPYQPEMSQGVLQAIFEYQTAVCELTGMDISNASGYDGMTVAADACYMAKHITGRGRIVVTEATSPQVRQVIKTYARGFGLEVVSAHSAASPGPAVVAETRARPRGDLPAAELLRLPRARSDAPRPRTEPGALAVAMSTPVARRPEAPGRYGCAIACGGQSAGAPQSFGGPHYGFLSCRAEHVRRMPGRIVGETVDTEGRRGYVLTLATREQHIRREKATSNITTNQTLIALGGLVYLSWLGPDGLREVGRPAWPSPGMRESGWQGRGSRLRSQIGQHSRRLPSASDAMRGT